jgi:hypothetical protein
VTTIEPPQKAVGKEDSEVIDDYSLFNPLAYLKEYHIKWDREDDFSAQFIHKAFESIPPQKTMIDVGGGPTIYQLISPRNKVEEITFAEYAESNRQAVQKWIKGDPDAFDWDPYFKHHLELEKRAYTDSIEEMKASVRAKVKEFLPCDLRLRPPIPGPERTFDIVSCHFTVEAVCKHDEELTGTIGTLLALSRPGGYLIMSSITDAVRYRVGDYDFHVYPMDRKRVEEVLQTLGCSILKIESGPAEPGRYYGGTFSIFAQKASR